MTIQEFLQRLLAHMGIESAEVVVEEGEFLSVQINVSEEDSGLLIGYHGEVLASLQKLLQSMYRKDESAKRITVNINDYKQRREAQLKEMTSRIAEKVIQSGRSYMFSYLPANERLIVHETISQTPEFEELESVSNGEGSARRLEIRLKTTSNE
jgi:spoIIIJ-associated protein